ncbi:MAG: hypothetical protein COS41_01930 [Elusimicrobia bacterium CG03_land_8_20_14_0_80_50_18]|nr:MAG: hypothetical protein COS41_01930 [Elusimicrobia bacterium CG03_land_8_20_14_0_80_50_18]
MENSTKNKLAALASHTLFLTCIGAVMLFRSSSGNYFEKLKNSIFLTAYSDERKTEELTALKNKIEEISGVKNAAVLTENEVLEAMEGALAKKDILLSIKSVEIPSLIKIYPGSLNYENFGRIASLIENMHGIKAVDSGGNAVKKLFVFASDFQKAIRFITALLLLSAFGAALGASSSMKYLSEKFRFLSERAVPPGDILLKYASELFLIPLASLIISMLILLAFYQTNRGGIMFFLTPGEILLMLALSSLPSASRLVKSA